MVLKKSLSNCFKKYQARVVLWHLYTCCGTCVHTHNKYDFKYFSENGACGTCDFLAVILCQRNVLCENLCYRFGTSNRHLTSGKGRVRVCFPDVFVKTMTKGSLQGRDGVSNFTLQSTTHLQGKPRWKLKAGTWSGNHGGILFTGFLSQTHDQLAFLNSPGLPEQRCHYAQWLGSPTLIIHQYNSLLTEPLTLWSSQSLSWDSLRWLCVVSSWQLKLTRTGTYKLIDYHIILTATDI